MWISTRYNTRFFLPSSVVFHTKTKSLNASGPQIARLRNERGWSQPELAAKCQLVGWDVSRDIIARIELRNRWVGDFELAIFAEIFGVTMEELMPRGSKRKR